MDNQILSHVNKMSLTTHSCIPALNFQLLSIFLFLILFFKANAQNQLKLKLQGKGDKHFIYQYFNKNPHEVFVNGQFKGNWIKACYFDNEDNDITVNFNEPIYNCDHMFLEIVDITEIDFTNLDLSHINSMISMFNGCINLKKIIFGNLDTSLVTNMYRLFFNCKELTSLDLSKFDTRSVITMQ